MKSRSKNQSKVEIAHVVHKNEDGTPKFTNRLSEETSPYLLQHAHNPVNWYPWGEEAFSEAEKTSRPILLSIGYATCHWCHVMERESFEDLEIADFLNNNYVAIKVDREQRPDVDAIYMASVQALTGAGGWPMTVWMTPDRKPFYGGTYFPPRAGVRGANVGFLEVLQRLHDVYKGQPDQVELQTKELVEAIRSQMMSSSKSSLSNEDLDRASSEAFGYFSSSFDSFDGGFGHAPKFPRPAVLEFLLEYSSRPEVPAQDAKRAREMVLFTLRKMIRGGLYDHLGGGIHRYSVDAQWLVPHFEKMLYDNAQLVQILAQAFQVTQDEEFRTAGLHTMDYVLREMTSNEGGFYSATDADSEGEEGKFFVWSPSEIEAELSSSEEAALFCQVYDVTEGGNFEGKNILNLSQSLSETADEMKIPFVELSRKLEKMRQSLYEVREKRVPPLTDDKILASWNAMMIESMAFAGFVFGEEKYVKAAKRATDFLLSNMMESGRLKRSYRNGNSQFEGYLDDYVFFISALLKLYEVTGESTYFQRAISFQFHIEQEFWDKEEGAFFATSQYHEDLISKEKSYYDGAEPSGNSIAVHNFWKFYKLTGEVTFREKGEKSLEAFGDVLKKIPYVSPLFLKAAQRVYGNSSEIVLMYPQDFERDGLMQIVRSEYLPHTVMVLCSGALGEPSLVPALVQGRKPIDNSPTAYVCVGRKCDLPTTDPEKFENQLRKACQ